MKKTKSLDSIKKIKKRAEPKLMAKKGVNGVAIGAKMTDGKFTGEIGITVFVDSKRDDISARDKIPKQIYGIKTDVVERKEKSVAYSSAMDPLRQYNPLVGGAAVGPARKFRLSQDMAPEFQRGTLAAIVIDKITGKPMLLSSYHVLAVDTNWHRGDAILQPPVDGGSSRVVGNLKDALLLGTEGIDAAVATIDASVQIAHAIAGIGPTNQIAEPVPYMRVRKSGIATGVTKGIIHTTEDKDDITYNFIGTRTMTHLIRILPDPPNTIFSTGGDSGSAIVADDGSGRIVGLLLGGPQTHQFTYANHIENILTKFSIKIS
jgi:hypothetical protein